MNFWDNFYRVEEDGSVYRLKGKGRKLEKKLKPHINNKGGYLMITMSINSKPKRMLISRLVALTFIPNPDNKEEVDHIDRNILNNHVSNLRWVNHLENQQNKKVGKSGIRNINIRSNGIYHITFRRNNLRYRKYFPKTSNMEEAIKQKDLMLSMFN